MRIGILETHVQTDSLLGSYGTLAEMIMTWLAPALPEAEFLEFPVIDGDPEPDLKRLDGLPVTGSRYGAYDNLPWIKPLEDLLRRARDRAIPMAGICFGHQIMAQAFGGTVVQHDGGWVLGREEYAPCMSEGRPMAALSFHQDQVISLPDSVVAFSGSERCRFGRLEYAFPALSVQYHPEYSKPYFSALLEECTGALIAPQSAEEATSRLHQTCDQARLAEQFASFFRRLSSSGPG